MHHSLKLYSRYQPAFLRAYILLAGLTRVPLLGSLVRKIGNLYGSNIAGGYLLTTEEAGRIVESAGGLALGPCSCREVFHNCSAPVGAEILVGPGSSVFREKRPDKFRDITAGEARDILKDSHDRGLIHAVVRCRDEYYAICNCCSCCCVPLRLSKRFGIRDALLRRKDIVELVTQGKPI